jgi:hypothetical protein
VSASFALASFLSSLVEGGGGGIRRPLAASARANQPSVPGSQLASLHDLCPAAVHYVLGKIKKFLTADLTGTMHLGRRK